MVEIKVVSIIGKVVIIFGIVVIIISGADGIIVVAIFCSSSFSSSGGFMQTLFESIKILNLCPPLQLELNIAEYC